MPATRRAIGVVDRSSRRVGAADDLARGRSTFMVEMVETADILNHAGAARARHPRRDRPRHRTYDGLSIAWAVARAPARRQPLPRAVRHALPRADRARAKLPRPAQPTVAVTEWQGEVVFLHEVREGVADRSYGVQVARLAGLPAAVVERAREVLEGARACGPRAGGEARALVDDLPLFSASARAADPPPGPSAVEARLRAALPDELTPRDALALVYELRGLFTRRR